MARPEHLWRGEPSFRHAFTKRDQYWFISFLAMFLLGWGLSYILPEYHVAPLTAFIPYILMYGGPVSAFALLHSIRTRATSGFKRVSYFISPTAAFILAVEPAIGNKTNIQGRVLAKWPLDGSVTPQLSGNHILFQPSKNPHKPMLTEGFLYLANPTEALNTLQTQIKHNA